jgi:hypothetical protein
MVTIDDIINRCVSLETKYQLGPLGLRDLKDLALLTIQHCQDRISIPSSPLPEIPGMAKKVLEDFGPYVKPWGGHQ